MEQKKDILKMTQGVVAAGYVPKRRFSEKTVNLSSAWEIGKGGYGSIHKTTHSSIGYVAVKTFRMDIPGDSAWRELDSLILFQHKRVIKLYGAMFCAIPLLVMELCPGTDIFYILVIIWDTCPT